MESYTPERMKDAIGMVLPTHSTNQESPLSQKHTRNLHKRNTSMASSSSASSFVSSSDNDDQENDKAANERTPLLTLPQTPKPNLTNQTTSPTRPLASPSPLKNGNYEVEADFLQAMMVVLEREASMTRNTSLTKHDIKKIVRKELQKSTNAPSAPKDAKGKGKAKQTSNDDNQAGDDEDENKARAAIRSALHSLDKPAPPTPSKLHEVEQSRIRAIVRQELANQHSPLTLPITKQLHEYISVSVILGATLGAAGIVLLRRMAERRPEEMPWYLDGAGKIGACVFGGLVIVKGVLWGAGRWWNRRREGGGRGQGGEVV